MNLEKFKESVKVDINNLIAKRRFNSIMSVVENPFEVNVFENNNDEAKLFVVPGYYPSDRVFEEIKKRVEPGSRVEIKVNLGDKKEIINYKKK